LALALLEDDGANLGSLDDSTGFDEGPAVGWLDDPCIGLDPEGFRIGFKCDLFKLDTEVVFLSSGFFSICGFFFAWTSSS
jgi:hypothetical protein